ncbi:MAG: Mut7-C ubiquitin/RNAse domain-containing protein [Chloroflexi bacterium]|nr:Mut7-C ubiquitin/RNAse domain-containing protein [Chloroflexota bacterium]
MSHAIFHFHDELNFFLPRRHKHGTIEHAFDWRASVKDMIESLGVPHAEVELIVVNGNAVDFSYVVLPDDQIDVYSQYDTVDMCDKIRLRPPLPAAPAFVLDQHLGRLAAYLRMMGFDTLYRNDYHDEELARISHDENRVLLTRDVGLLKRSLVIYGYYVRATHREQQLVEITRRFNLPAAAAPFKHCMKCNGLLDPVAKAAILDRLPDGTAQYYDEFHRCQSCQRIYWKGPHFQKMQQLVEQVLFDKP